MQRRRFVRPVESDVHRHTVMELDTYAEELSEEDSLEYDDKFALLWAAVRRHATEYEMSRREKMAAAKCDLTDAMAQHELTAMEWVNVLNEMLSRMVEYGLAEEWTDDGSKRTNERD